jgi:hypothetical protein
VRWASYGDRLAPEGGTWGQTISWLVSAESRSKASAGQDGLVLLSDWAASSTVPEPSGSRSPASRPRRLEFLKLGTLELVESDGRSHGDAVVRAGRSDLNTDSRIPVSSPRNRSRSHPFRTGTVLGLGCAAGHCWSRRDGRVRPARDPSFAASVESRLARCERRGGRCCLRRRAVYFVL